MEPDRLSCWMAVTVMRENFNIRVKLSAAKPLTNIHICVIILGE